jgi:CubicO group peptidase (beta-lactamase class C family)
MARGVYGQRLYIDPKARMVVAKFGSNPVPGGASTDEAYQSVLDALATCLESEDKLKQDNNGALPRK